MASLTVVSVLLNGFCEHSAPPPGWRLAGALERSAHCPGEMPSGVLWWPWAARGDVIVVAAVFVVSEEDYGVFPVGAIANGVEDLGNVGFASLDVGGRVLVVFERAAE